MSDTQQVWFSQGNLQYNGGNSTWRFAEHQYDYVGSWNTTEWVDLFGWGAWTESSPNPTNTSTTNSDYSFESTDFDQTLHGSDAWRTLTKDEWVYLFNTRIDAASKKGHGKVNNVTGMILLPDEWTLPDGLTFTAGNSSWANVYTLEQWAQMEASGAVFLPAAGQRNETTVGIVGMNGIYWSSTFLDSNNAYRLTFSNDYINPQSDNSCCTGHCVRLVQDMN